MVYRVLHTVENFDRVTNRESCAQGTARSGRHSLSDYVPSIPIIRPVFLAWCNATYRWPLNHTPEYRSLITKQRFRYRILPFTARGVFFFPLMARELYNDTRKVEIEQKRKVTVHPIGGLVHESRIKLQSSQISLWNVHIWIFFWNFIFPISLAANFGKILFWNCNRNFG